MVIKDINKENFRLLIEEKKIGNFIYRISDSYAPTMGNITKRICIKKINEQDEKAYGIIHGLDLSDDNLRSYYLVEDKNGSSQASKYLEDQFEYCEEIISSFEELINKEIIKSGKSEFSEDALKVLEEVKKSYKDNIGVKTNAI